MIDDVVVSGSLSVSWLGVLFVAGMAISLPLTARTAKAAGLAPREVWIPILWCVPLGFLGQRLLWVLLHLPEFLADPSRILTGSGGMFYGGLILCALLAFLYARRTGIGFWRLADTLYPLVLVQVLGRVGCFLDGCCFGRPTTVPWGVPSGLSAHFRERGLDDFTIHPTQLYHVAADGALLFVLHLLFRRRHFDGQVVLVYALGYGVSRFVIEFFRYDFELGLNVAGILSTNQVFSLVLLIAASLGLWYRLQRRGDSPVPSGRMESPYS